MRIDYVPGDGLAVVAGRTAVLLPDGCASELLEQLWASVQGGATLTDHLQVLLGPGLAAAPAFALVQLTDDGAHVVVRGATQAEVVTADASRVVTAANVATWSEQTVPGATAARLSGPRAAQSGPLPVVAGVLLADTVLLRPLPAAGGLRAPISEPAATRPATGEGPAVSGPVPVATIEVSEPVLRAPAPVAAPTPAPGPAPSDELVPADDRESAEHDGAADDEPDVVAMLPAWEPVRVGPAETGSSPLTGSFGAVSADPEQVRRERRDTEEEQPATSGSSSTTANPLSAVPPLPPAPSLTAVPSLNAGRPLTAVPPLPNDQDDDEPEESTAPPVRRGLPEDHDGLTVLSSDMVALRRQLPEWAGDAVPQLAVPTPHNPAPAKLLMSTGLVVSLNRPVLIGRAPQVTRVANNEIPRLITVASPNQDISRTHAEVRMDGEDVVVTDLRSTNGVLLLRQGQGAQRLHPGEPTVVEQGVVVDLGEGVTFLVEAGG
ncbi:FHA domain-containing protein [Actinotalea sp. M2MS4P-6]|uniref:FHA domain-containing protein n=1 Tax=Actinotalea sp. M2MS4P-6 TaxID=2983762 RepID=UPI0021E45A58|nr:FHA domain-containing protein [Actinotalea sp. M2MS4P-6]MCV2395618.1 FHA domain-containing protein [Actinotalea sp. M2MS4P-6]